ncbi:hypothetical protein GGS20DRAFT_573910 [Poronia punctata]|nr:hypothetical protein GGS20DRAFT_573910 [Poronia punctata]
MNTVTILFVVLAAFLARVIASPVAGNYSGCTHIDHPRVVTNTTCTIPQQNGKNNIKMASDKEDKIPIWELPDCYQKCMDKNRHHASFVGDVYDLSTHDFCWKYQFTIEEWMLDWLVPCVGRKCKSCRPGCKEDSVRWMKKYCGRDPS